MKVKDFLKQIIAYKEKYPDNNVEEYEIIFKDNKQSSEDNYIDISFFLDDVKKFTLGGKNLATEFKNSTADKNGLEPFNILTPCGDKASLIFNELPDVSAEESNVNSDVATKQIVKLEKAYNIPAAEWTSNGLIELEVLIPKSMTKNEYILNFIALDDLIYDNKVVVPRGAKIRYFSKLYEVKEYDKESNVVEAALDIRPTNTFGSDYVADKMSNFSITAVAYTKNL